MGKHFSEILLKFVCVNDEKMRAPPPKKKTKTKTKTASRQGMKPMGSVLITRS